MKQLIEFWDWWIYRRSFNTLRRMCERNGGFAYIIRCHIDEWLRKNPLPEEVKRSAESFYKAIIGK